MQWRLGMMQLDRQRTLVVVATSGVIACLVGCNGETLYDSTSDDLGGVRPAGNHAPRADLSVTPDAVMAPVKAQIVLTCSDADGDRLTYRVGYTSIGVWEISQAEPIQTARSFTAPVMIRGECQDDHGAVSGAATHPLLVINAPVQRDSILQLTNAARSQNAIPALSLDASLSQVAQDHARDMADRNYFSHTTPDGITFSQRLQAAGVVYTAAGENIAGNSSAEATVQAWMNSTGHRSNILNASFRRLGVGVYRDLSSPYTYFVQVFTN